MAIQGSSDIPSNRGLGPQGESRPLRPELTGKTDGFKATTGLAKFGALLKSIGNWAASFFTSCGSKPKNLDLEGRRLVPGGPQPSASRVGGVAAQTPPLNRGESIGYMMEGLSAFHSVYVSAHENPDQWRNMNIGREDSQLRNMHTKNHRLVLIDGQPIDKKQAQGREARAIVSDYLLPAYEQVKKNIGDRHYASRAEFIGTHSGRVGYILNAARQATPPPSADELQKMEKFARLFNLTLGIDLPSDKSKR